MAKKYISIQHIHATEAELTTGNRVLLKGQVAFSDNGTEVRQKVGDGVTAYNDLPFVGASSLATRVININGDDKNLNADREWRVAQADTGCLTSVGLTANSGTAIDIGAVTGYIIDNETDPANPVYTKVTYVGETNKTVTTLGSGLSTYVMLGVGGVISFQNTFPTSTERKAKIWLGKVGHPSGTITTVINEPDYITSPQAFARDLFQVLGPYINDGVYAYANGANLNINITAGNIHGNGINFDNDRTAPNEIAVGPHAPLSFLYRTRTGVGGGFVTSIDPNSYDVGGVITAIGGGSNNSTIQYIFCIPGVGFVIQYGQTVYANLITAIGNIGRELFTVYSNLPNNAILIGVVALRRTATALNDTSQAQFFNADKLGQIIGATSGISVGTLQTAYNNSLTPEITTNATAGALTVKRGSAADTDTVLEVLNGSESTTFSVTGNGVINFTDSTNSASVLQKIRVVLWGDSLTAGSGVSSANYGIQLAKTIGLSVNNQGVGGNTSSQILTRFNAAASDWVYPTIIWSGRNNYSSPTTVKADISAMVSSLGHTNYLILSILNSDTPAEYIGQPNYTTITTLNSDLAALYGSHYLDVRAYLLTQGDGSGGDNTDIANGVSPRSLRNTGDALHLNALGYSKISAYIVANGINFITPTINKPLGIDSIRTLFNNAPNIGGTELAKGYFNKLQLGSTDPKFSDEFQTALTFVTGGIPLHVSQSNSGGALFIGGNLLFPTDNTYDIGQGIGLFGARNGYFSGTVNAAGFIATTAFRFGSPNTAAPLEIAETGAAVSGTVAVFGKFDSTGRWEIVNAGGTTSRRIMKGYSGTTQNIQLDPSNVSYFNNALAIGTASATGSNKLTVNGTAIIQGGAEALKVSTAPGNPDHAYLGFYARTASPTTQSGYVGYNGVASTTLTIANSISNGDINVTTTGIGRIVLNGVTRLKNYTVSTLPTGVQGDRAYVTDATAPTYNATAVGGGSVKVPVFFNGANWVTA